MTIPDLKPLPRDDAGNYLPFTTAKGTYVPLQPGRPYGIKRWTEHNKLSIALGGGKTFEMLDAHFVAHAKLLNTRGRTAEDILYEAILSNASARRAIVEMSKERYHTAFYLATIFYVREGDNPLEWSYEMANDYVEDWTAYGIDPETVFFFGLRTVTGYKRIYDDIMEKIRAETEGSPLATIGSKTENIEMR